MPGRPRTPEAGAPAEPASAPVDGHGHQFRRGVDQPDYVRLLRCFASLDRTARHASVTRRVASYGFHLPGVDAPPGFVVLFLRRLEYFERREGDAR